MGDILILASGGREPPGSELGDRQNGRDQCVSPQSDLRVSHTSRSSNIQGAHAPRSPRGWEQAQVTVDL